MEKLLSIVLAARNDNYKDNFISRLTNSVNYISRNIQSLGYSKVMEIIIVDWNSSIPIQNDLNLNKDAFDLVKFINVPPKVAESVMHPDKVFQLPCALNTGIRRSNSEFIVVLSADCIISKFSLKNMYELLLGKVKVNFNIKNQLSIIPTKLLPYDPSHLDFESKDFDEIIFKSGPELNTICKGIPGTGLGHIAMMSNSIWKKYRGYDEKFIHYGWQEEELALRVTQELPWFNLSFLGIYIIDFEEPKNNEQIKQKVNSHRVPYNSIPNNKNWGLGNHKLEKISLQEQNKRKVQFRKAQKSKISVKQLNKQLNSKANLKNLYKPGRINFNSKLYEWEIFTILSWFSLNDICKSFLQVGLKNYQNSLIIINKFPCSNFYVVDSWRKNKNSLKPHLLSEIICRNGYRGHIRFITGNEEKGLNNLFKLSKNKLHFNLSLVYLEVIKNDPLSVLKSIYLNSSAESVIMIVHNNYQEMNKIVEESKKFLENCTLFVTGSRFIVVIFKNKIKDERFDKVNGYGIISLGSLPKWNWLLKMNYRAILRSPINYPFYLYKIFKRTFQIIFNSKAI